MSKQSDKPDMGYMWYPKDWWSSKTFFKLKSPVMRLFYREVIDLINMNGGFWEADKEYFEALQRVEISVDDWSKLSSLFVVDEYGKWTHPAVTKRKLRSPAQQAQAEANLAKMNASKKPEEPKKSPEQNTEEFSPVTEAHRPYIKEKKRKEEKVNEMKPLKGVDISSYLQILSGREDTAETRQNLLRVLLAQKHTNTDEGGLEWIEQDIGDLMEDAKVNEQKLSMQPEVRQMIVRIKNMPDVEMRKMIDASGMKNFLIKMLTDKS